MRIHRIISDRFHTEAAEHNSRKPVNVIAHEQQNLEETGTAEASEKTPKGRTKKKTSEV